MELGTVSDWFTGLATFFAACVALHLGLRKAVHLLVNLQPRDIAALNVNCLDLFISNRGSHAALIRSVRLRISLIDRRLWCHEFPIPADWHTGVNMPNSIAPGDVAITELYPTFLVAANPASFWVDALRDRHWYQLWKLAACQRFSIIVSTEDGSSYKRRLQGEVRRRMRSALAISPSAAVVPSVQ